MKVFKGCGSLTNDDVMKLSQKHFWILLGILSPILVPIAWYVSFSLAAQQLAGFPVNPEHTSFASILLLAGVGLNGFFGYFIFKQAKQAKTNAINLLKIKQKQQKLKRNEKIKLKKTLETLEQIRFPPPLLSSVLLATLQITPFTSVFSGLFPFILSRQLQRLDNNFEQGKKQLAHFARGYKKEKQFKQKTKPNLPSPLKGLIASFVTYNMYSSYWWTKIILFIWNFRMAT